MVPQRHMPRDEQVRERRPRARHATTSAVARCVTAMGSGQVDGSDVAMAQRAGVHSATGGGRSPHASAHSSEHTFTSSSVHTAFNPGVEGSPLTVNVDRSAAEQSQVDS